MALLQLPGGPARIFHIANARRHGNGTERNLHGVVSPVWVEHSKPLRDHAVASVVLHVVFAHEVCCQRCCGWCCVLHWRATPGQSQPKAAPFTVSRALHTASTSIHGTPMASTLLRASNDQIISLRAWRNIFSGWWPKICPHLGTSRGRKPSYAAAGCSPTLAALRKRGQRASNPGWAVLRQARGRQTRKLPAGHLGTFLRRRLLRMRYTASCVQICDARIRGERHANQFACNKEVT